MRPEGSRLLTRRAWTSSAAPVSGLPTARRWGRRLEKVSISPPPLLCDRGHISACLGTLWPYLQLIGIE